MLTNTVNSEMFAKVLFSRSFVKMKSSLNGEITLSFTDIGISCHSRDFLASHICLLMHAYRGNKVLALQ